MNTTQQLDKSKDNGGPAFPRVVEQPNGYMQAVEGMSLRDFFAAEALGGILANPDISASAARCNVSTADFRSDTARAAYAMADALLAERSKT